MLHDLAIRAAMPGQPRDVDLGQVESPGRQTIRRRRRLVADRDPLAQSVLDRLRDQDMVQPLALPFRLLLIGAALLGVSAATQSDPPALQHALANLRVGVAACERFSSAEPAATPARQILELVVHAWNMPRIRRLAGTSSATVDNRLPASRPPLDFHGGPHVATR